MTVPVTVHTVPAAASTAPPTTVPYDPIITVTEDPTCPDLGDGTAKWTIVFDDHLGKRVTVTKVQQIGTTVKQAPVRLTHVVETYSMYVEQLAVYSPTAETDVNCQMVGMNTTRIG